MSLYGALAETVREGKEIYTVRQALDGSGELEIRTPYASIDAAVATVEGATAPDAVVLACEIDGGLVTVRGYDGDGVASAAEETVSVIIIGRRRQ